VLKNAHENIIFTQGAVKDAELMPMGVELLGVQRTNIITASSTPLVLILEEEQEEHEEQEEREEEQEQNRRRRRNRRRNRYPIRGLEFFHLEDVSLEEHNAHVEIVTLECRESNHIRLHKHLLDLL